MAIVRHVTPGARWFLADDIREFWQYRRLFAFLLWRDFKIRYKQTAIGVVWAVFQPLLTLAVVTFIFSRFPGLSPYPAVPYAVFVYSGLLLWNFFANAVTDASASLVSHPGLVTKVYCPRMLIPLSSVVIQCVDLVLSLVFLILLARYFGYGLHLAGFLVLPLYLLVMMLASGSIGIVLSAFNVRYRDIGHLLPFFMQLLLFLTPVIYGTRIFSTFTSTVLSANPMTAVIEGFREAALFGTVDWASAALALLYALLLFAAAAQIFKHAERAFSDTL